MSLTALPAELLEAIFEPLSQSTLAALARTNGDLYACATRLLYRHVSITTFGRNLSAVRTLAARPHLAGLVRTFSICLDEREEPDAAYPAALHTALQGMTSLAALDVHVAADLSWVLSGAAQYASLETFACSFPLDAHVARFLERTPALRALQVAPSPACAPLAPTAVPLLESYTGPPCALAHLLPTRPLSTLLLSGDLTLAHAAELNARVETLSATTSSAPAAVIEALAAACPSLASLRVITTCPFPDLAFCGRIASALAGLSKLAVFELGGMHWEFRPKAAPALNGAGGGVCAEMEWASPPVSPRSADTNDLPLPDNDYDFDGGAFMEWAY